VTGVDWGRDGDVVSCSMDHTVRAWDLDTQQCTINLGEDLSLSLSLSLPLPLFLSLARTLLSAWDSKAQAFRPVTLAFSPKRSARAHTLSLGTTRFLQHAIFLKA
jgi:hypothetical protein